LPVATDFLVLNSIIHAVFERDDKDLEPLLFLPPIPYGKKRRTLAFFPVPYPLCSRTMLALIDDVIASLAVSEFQKVVILNGHGGNTAFLRGISQELKWLYRTDYFFILITGDCHFFDRTLPHDSPWENEIHAGEVETSLLLYLAPKLVKQETEASGFLLPENYGCRSYLCLVSRGAE